MAEAAKVEKVVTTVTVNLTLTEEEAAYLGGLLIEGPNWDTAPWARDIHEALSAAGARHKALSLRYEGKEMYTNFDVSEVGGGAF